ncbi:MAG TPA: hypothetical protein VF068_10120 [Rubrobacter sp.]
MEFVAPEEIEAAIGKVIADAYGMDRQEIPPAVVCVLLGFKRTTEANQARVTRVLDGMFGHSLQNVTVATLPRPEGGVKVELRDTDREGVRERQPTVYPSSDRSKCTIRKIPR